MKAATISLLAIFATTQITPAPSPEADKALHAFDERLGRDAEVSAEIAAMFAREQAARFAIIEVMQNPALTGEDRAWLTEHAGARIDSMDEANTARLEEILETTGWRELAQMQGGRTVRHAWSIVSHADHNTEFQRAVLETVRPLVASGSFGDIGPAQFAKISDSVAISSGQPQKYGTQLICENGEWVAMELESPEQLDERRAEVGLPPFDVYLLQHLEFYGPCDP